MADRPNVEDVFEAWAHVAARIRKRPGFEQRAILTDLGIGQEWEAVHETWSRRLNEDILAGQMDRPERYAQICREEQQRRRRSRVLTPPLGLDAGATPGPETPHVSHGAPAIAPGTPMFGARLLAGVPEAVPATQPGAPLATSPLPFGATDFRGELADVEKPRTLQEDTAQLAIEPDDFRRAFVPQGSAPPPPLPGQDDTAPGVGHTETVLAARQTSEVASWPPERWAQLCVALEREPHRADELWREQGITNPNATEHAQRFWQRRLNGDPQLQAEVMAIIARLRG